MKPAGYSKTPLAKKLGYKSGFCVFVVNAPSHYDEIVAPLPDDVAFAERSESGLDMIHFFSKRRAELQEKMPVFMDLIKKSGMIWISWPKKASGVETDITEDVIREIVLPLGLVDIKVCAVDDVWSGLKIVIRKENRG